jgi:hypothetical protein
MAGFFFSFFLMIRFDQVLLELSWWSRLQGWQLTFIMTEFNWISRWYGWKPGASWLQCWHDNFRSWGLKTLCFLIAGFPWRLFLITGLIFSFPWEFPNDRVYLIFPHSRVKIMIISYH